MLKHIRYLQLRRTSKRGVMLGVVVSIFQTSVTGFVSCLWDWCLIDQSGGNAHADPHYLNTFTSGSQNVPGGSQLVILSSK